MKQVQENIHQYIYTHKVYNHIYSPKTTRRWFKTNLIVRAHLDKKSLNVIKLLVKVTHLNGIVVARKYYRLKYDSTGKLTHYKKRLVQKNMQGVEEFEQYYHVVYSNKSIIHYQDRKGNEWKETWGIPLPYEHKHLFYHRIDSSIELMRFQMVLEIKEYRRQKDRNRVFL